ncbi:transposon Tf2-9 polyprotein [Trichonephila clavipes]|uniref:Transposon Tf2-9 polyprotein n=1 Tax=Trichonephila clavipes TaxID=2585209 RepID=A0A8X6VDN7_TRICX|nr:transposon Tf2-9 polyprotein [Trichonephila clavipes]
MDFTEINSRGKRGELLGRIDRQNSSFRTAKTTIIKFGLHASFVELESAKSALNELRTTFGGAYVGTFLQQLPTAVQTILASITPITVEKAAEVADRILEKERTPERRNSSRPRNRSRNRSFSRSRESCCWYHKSFKNELRNAFHHAAIKKKTNQRGVNATTFSQPHISRRLFIKDKSSNTAFLIDTGSDVSVLPASLSEKRKGNSIQQLSAANTSPINVYEIVKPPSFSQEVKHNIKHFIETSGPPVFAKARRLAPDRLKIAKSEFQHMLNLGHVRPSKSNYASPLHIVPKKDSNDWRPVVTIVH